MDVIALAAEIIGGRRLVRQDDLSFLFTADLDELCHGADMIRAGLCGDGFDLCTIVNGRSGCCSEDCKFCAQSAHNCTDINEYGFLDESELLRECRYNAEKGIRRFAVVTSGRTLNDEDFRKALSAYRLMKSQCGDSMGTQLCASHGFLTEEQFRQLVDAGVTRIHCNIETSRRNFPNICTTHTFDEKIGCIKRAQRAGAKVCSGGIIGMGETWEDRLDMALTLAELNIDSVPINVLKPINGTPFGELPRLSENEIIRTMAMFRYVIPTAYIRFAAGRDMLYNSGERAFRSGVNAAITGDMLTTSGSCIDSDLKLIASLNFNLA